MFEKLKQKQPAYIYDTVSVGPDSPDQKVEIDGRHIVRSDTEVLGGAYIHPATIHDKRFKQKKEGAYEITVPVIDDRVVMVDYDRNPGIYDDYLSLAGRRASIRGRVNKARLPKAVFETVDRKAMRRDARGHKPDVSWRNEREGELAGKNVNLSELLIHGGAEPHQATLAYAALMESLVKNGDIQGDVSLDFSSRIDTNDTSNREIRTIARYIDSVGEPWVADFDGGYFGKLKDSTKESWNYMRPGDAQYLEAREQEYATKLKEYNEWQNEMRLVGAKALEVYDEPKEHDYDDKRTA